MSTSQRERFNREMHDISIKIERLAVGHGDDDSVVKGLRGFVGIMWGQIDEKLGEAERYMTDAALLKMWEDDAR